MNPFDDPEVKTYLESFRREVMPKITDSNMIFALITEKPDPKLCLEVGAAILLDKPLIICVRPGQKISDNLRMAAVKNRRGCFRWGWRQVERDRSEAA